MTDAEITERFKGGLTIGELIDMQKNYAPETVARIRDLVDEPDWREQDAHLNEKIREMTASLLPRLDLSHVFPKLTQGLVPKLDVMPKLDFKTTRRPELPPPARTKFDSLVAWDELRERSRETTEAVVIAQDELDRQQGDQQVDATTRVLQQLLDHQLRESRSTQAYADAQFTEAQRSRIMNRKTLRVTRAATMGGILAGPLAVILATHSRLDGQAQVAISVVWAVLVGVAFIWEKADPVLDEVERQQRAALEADVQRPDSDPRAS